MIWPDSTRKYMLREMLSSGNFICVVNQSKPLCSDPTVHHCIPASYGGTMKLNLYGNSIPVKSTDFGGSLPIFLPSYRQPTDLPQSTDFYRFFRGSTEF